MHVTVVGAGLAGLATAVHLAAVGARVTVLEAAPELGGRARSTTHGGAILNFGPHALFGDAQDELVALGVSPSARFPVQPTRLVRRGELISPLAFLRLGGWFTRLLVRRADELDGVTVDDWLAAEVSEAQRPLARAAITLVTYTRRGDLDAGAAVRQVQNSVRVRYVDGGWQALVDGLRRRVLALGGEIRVGAAARRLVGTRVELDHGEVDGDAVVVAASADRARELIPELPEVEVGRASCLDLALSAVPRRSPGFVVGVDEPLYLSVHSNVARLGPGAVVHVAAYGETGRERLEALMDQAQPGWRALVTHARWLPRIAVMHGLPVVGAARPALEPRPGVVLAGEWLGHGFLAGAALRSAREAASRVQAIAGRAAA